MTVLIDKPRWPAHGTLFGHLVSDTSLEELHDLAEAAGLPPRAFDRDHYDVPASLYDDCVAAGALEAPSRELVRALRQANLRVTKADWHADREARRERLRQRWPLATGPADDLLERWSSRGRYYHDLRHLEHCLDSLDVVGADEPVVALAAWFHDAVYEGRPGRDEDDSAALAESTLEPILPRADVREVARLVRLTAGHQPADADVRGQQLCDADLAILAADPARYAVYRRDVRREYHEVPLAMFRSGRRQVLTHLAALDPLYRTDPGRELWTAPAMVNLAAEIALLEARARAR
ncbi:DUF4031 domain-containing protein [Propionibacteriaceae bacterium G1746]|uniref:DUF4031 domain-containing protein n=1 Tax=Aestuariimicrobium sp. G57 TaxID=3418485 RepID=UPI003C1D51CC